MATCWCRLFACVAMALFCVPSAQGRNATALYWKCHGENKASHPTPDGSGIVCQDGVKQTIKMLDATTGNTVWSHSVFDPYEMSVKFFPQPPLVYADGVAYDQRTGTKRWSVGWNRKTCWDLKNHVAVDEIGNTFVMACNYPYTKPTVYHIYGYSMLTGEPVWNYSTSRYGTMVGEFVAGGVYTYEIVSSTAATVSGLNATTGAKLWRQNISNGPSPYAVGPDMATIMVGSGLYNLRGWAPPTGQQVWKVTDIISELITFRGEGNTGYFGLAYVNKLHDLVLLDQATGRVVWRTPMGRVVWWLQRVKTSILLLQHVGGNVTAVCLTRRAILWTSAPINRLISTTTTSPYFYAPDAAHTVAVYNATSGGIVSRAPLLANETVDRISVADNANIVLLQYKRRQAGVQAFRI